MLEGCLSSDESAGPIRPLNMACGFHHCWIFPVLNQSHTIKGTHVTGMSRSSHVSILHWFVKTASLYMPLTLLVREAILVHNHLWHRDQAFGNNCQMFCNYVIIERPGCHALHCMELSLGSEAAYPIWHVPGSQWHIHLPSLTEFTNLPLMCCSNYLLLCYGLDTAGRVTWVMGWNGPAGHRLPTPWISNMYKERVRMNHLPLKWTRLRRGPDMHVQSVNTYLFHVRPVHYLQFLLKQPMKSSESFLPNKPNLATTTTKLQKVIVSVKMVMCYIHLPNAPWSQSRSSSLCLLFLF